jgi:hypothetical protein
MRESAMLPKPAVAIADRLVGYGPKPTASNRDYTPPLADSGPGGGRHVRAGTNAVDRRCDSI